MKFNAPYDYIGRTGSTATQISQTVPDMSLSVRDILDRFTRGLPTESIDAYYSSVEDFDDIPANLPPDFDLTDIDEARRNTDVWAQTWKEEQLALEEERQRKLEEVKPPTPPNTV